MTDREERGHQTIPFASLFSGAMGLDLGLEAAGFESVACVESDVDSQETIRLNRPSLPVLGDIAQTTGDDILKAAGVARVPLVVGGPPCQAFSVFGNRAGIEDIRGQLIFQFVKIVEQLRPDVFLLENVRGLLSMPVIPRKKSLTGGYPPDLTEHGSLLRMLLQEFNKLGYRVDCYVVNAVNYGAPQIRERLICIGNRHGLDTEMPGPEYSNRLEDGLPPFTTLGDVIGDGFRDPCPEVMNFSPRKLRYLSMIPPGGNWRSLPVEIQKESMGKSWYLKGGRSAYWRKLSFAFPSPTVVTMPNHAGTSMCHPRELRAITVGEAAAIQEFPSSWRFGGTTTSKFRQIGNAVPIRLGIVAGNAIQDLFRRIASESSPPLAQDWPAMHNRVVHLRPHVRTRTFWKDGRVFSGDVSYYDDDDGESSRNHQLALISASSTSTIHARHANLNRLMEEHPND